MRNPQIPSANRRFHLLVAAAALVRLCFVAASSASTKSAVDTSSSAASTGVSTPGLPTKWEVVSTPISDDVYDVAANGSTWIAVSTGIERSTDDGLTWTSGQAGTDPLNGVAVQGSTWISGGLGNSMYKSKNNGASWQAIPRPSQPVRALAANSSTLVDIGSYGSNIYTTTNRGKKWTSAQVSGALDLGEVANHASTWVAANWTAGSLT